MGLFEIHFHDSEFKPAMHLGPKEKGETEHEGAEMGHEDIETSDDPADGGRSILLAVVAALAALAVGAVVVKKFTS